MPFAVNKHDSLERQKHEKTSMIFEPDQMSVVLIINSIGQTHGSHNVKDSLMCNDCLIVLVDWTTLTSGLA